MTSAMSCPIRALANPVRRAILRSLLAGHDPADLRDELTGAPLPNLEAHLRVLVQSGLVRQVGHSGEGHYVLERGQAQELAVFLRGLLQEV